MRGSVRKARNVPTAGPEEGASVRATTPLDAQTLWELRGAAGLLGRGEGRRGTAPRLTESQIAFIFQEAGEGAPIAQICAAVGLTDAAYLNWRRRFGGLLASEYNYVLELEAQVRRLQLELADLLDMPLADEEAASPDRSGVVNPLLRSAARSSHRARRRGPPCRA